MNNSKAITHIKTHRCEQLLKRNKNANGLNVAIRYGKMYSSPYGVQENRWWLDTIQCDLDYDATWMSPACSIIFCPFCGEKLNESE